MDDVVAVQQVANSFSMTATYSFLKYLRYKQTRTSSGVAGLYCSDSQTGGNYPPGVICDSSGGKAELNHNAVLYYYERSLQKKPLN